MTKNNRSLRNYILVSRQFSYKDNRRRVHSDELQRYGTVQSIQLGWIIERYKKCVYYDFKCTSDSRGGRGREYFTFGNINIIYICKDDMPNFLWKHVKYCCYLLIADDRIIVCFGAEDSLTPCRNTCRSNSCK